MLSGLIQTLTSLPPLVYVATALATLLYFKMRTKSHLANIPPFPVKPYPIVGHLPMLRAGMLKTISEWTKSTGEIFSICVGRELFVVMSRLDIIREALVKKADHFSDRPPSMLLEDERKTGEGHGIIFNSGASWKEQRTVSLSILRNFGMGKNWLAEKINEEVNAYLDVLAGFKGEAKEIKILTNASVSNVICAILIGQRFELDDPYFTRLLTLINLQLKLISSFSPVASFPFLKYLPGDLFNEKKLAENRKDIIEHFSIKFVREKGTGEDMDSPDCFIHAYNQEMQHRVATGQNTTLNKENLTRVITNLFVAGTETTSTSLLWAMLFALHHPQCQDKIHQEIEEQFGSDRLPSMQDKARMPYTSAFIMESQRLGCIAAFTGPHYCSETTDVGGYTIPKGTTIMPNLQAVLKDPETWGDPLNFRPERFLDKDQKIFVPEEFVPFSMGRRICLGESLAKMELFLFLTGIFQRFRLEPEDPDNLPTTEPVPGGTLSPAPFKLRFIEKTEK